jgi:CBS domain-containing protein
MQAHVRTVMKDHLATVGPDDPLVDVARELAAQETGAIAVVDRDQRLIGVVSTTDLVNLLHDGATLHERTTRDVMSSEPISIDEFATTDEAIGLMRNALISHLPVTREGRLVGMVTASDLVRHLLQNYLAPEIA